MCVSMFCFASLHVQSMCREGSGCDPTPPSHTSSPSQEGRDETMKDRRRRGDIELCRPLFVKQLTMDCMQGRGEG